MEKKSFLYELIIKFIYFLFAFVASVFVVKNIISIFPLFKSFQLDEIQLNDVILKTTFGKIYYDMGVVEYINLKTIFKAISAFFTNIEGIVIVFGIITIAMLLIYFIFTKWKLISYYLNKSNYLAMLYIWKHILFAVCILFFYRNSLSSLSLSFVLGTSIYLILSLIELFILSIWMIKFIFDFIKVLKTIYNY